MIAMPPISLFRLCAAVLLLLHAVVVLSLIPRWSATFNEPGHLAAGVACWNSGAYHLYSVNPPLPRMVATIPLIFLDSDELCLEALSHLEEGRETREEVEIGRRLAETNTFNYQRLLCRARLAGVAWVTIGGFLVWQWARSLFGDWGGLLSLALWTVDPMVTAHSALATADVPSTVIALGASFSFAKFMRTGGRLDAAIAGMLLGAALLSKFTLIVLIPAWCLSLLFACKYQKHRMMRKMISSAICKRLLVVASIALVTLNLGYGFSGTGQPVGDINFRSKMFNDILRYFPPSWATSMPNPFPYDYVSGIDLQQCDFEGGLKSYLNGAWSDDGWWYYYAYAFFLKAPLGHLAIYFVSAILLLSLRQKPPILVAALPAFVILIASSKTGFTNHLRYILPAYPFIMIMSGVLLSSAGGRPKKGYFVFACVMLACSALSTFSEYPYQLSYFNEIAGGFQGGWRYLASSNVDWGQDWIALREWIDLNSDKPTLYIDLLDSHIDALIYLKKHYEAPNPYLPGYAIVDAYKLTTEHVWLQDFPLVDRIGSSIFVFNVPP